MKLYLIIFLEICFFLLIYINLPIYLLIMFRIVILWLIFKPISPPADSPSQNELEKEAKYLALQNQINPHFLYNTLEGIRSEALLGGLPNVAHMSELLARFFRYNISNLSQVVTLEEELENLETYFQIQQFRFEDKIKLETIFNEDMNYILSLKVPKLILQPIVENAIQHGIEPLTRKGTIKVRFQSYEKLLIITVSDDGVGICDEQLHAINEKMLNHESSELSIGMENVNKRLKILFGSEFGLQVYSNVGIGTDVEITIPIQGDSSK